MTRPRFARVALLALAPLLLGAPPVAAKEVYLTVRRDFGPNEAPEIDVHFTASAPFSFRVLRPRDLDAFVAQQIDLRRAWRQPKVETNSARLLFHGLNHGGLSLDWLRGAVDGPMRKRLAEELGGGSYSERGTLLAEGPEKLIATPEGFDLVTEIAVYPDARDTATPFDVPGFNWWFSESGNLRQRTVVFPKLSPGFYLVQALQGDLEGQVVLVVNDVTAELQQTDGAALVRVARRDGTPLPGATVDVRNLQGAFVARGKTDADGVLPLDDVKGSELLAVIRHGKDVAVIDTEFFPTTALFPDVYLYTDRPLYKRGNVVKFRGILREPVEGKSRLLGWLSGAPPTAATVSLVDLDGTKVVKEVEARLSAFGTFSGELPLGDQELSGVYRVVATVAGARHAGEIRVKEYVKPVFFLKLKTDQETLKAGDTLTAEVSVERYAGGVPAGVTFGAQLFRVRAETPAWIEDAGLGETGSTTTYGWDAKGESAIVPYLVATAEELSFDAAGRSTLELTLPATLPGPPNFDYKLLLKLFAKDPDGLSAGLSRTFLDRRSEVVALARMSAVLAGPSRPATLTVRAVLPSGKPYGKTSGEVALTLTPYRRPPSTRTVPFTTGEDGRFEMPVPIDVPGKLSATVTLRDRAGRATTAEASIVVASAKAGEPLVDVTELVALPEREVLGPRGTARALLLLPSGWGEGGANRGRLHLTFAGRRIHSHRVQAVDGLSTWISEPVGSGWGTAASCIVSYPDPERGWVERTLTFRIPPRDRALTVAVSPHAALAAPGKRQGVTLRVTDAAGKPVEAELSLSVVDKAVLDLAPEFRPPLLEFFYPLERLNLMTFFSREFQGYGYGERLAARFTPNYWMAATKPKKNPREQDTAHWNARVTTGPDGRATVSFLLPANQTTWHVSAVAADTSGRFGEGNAEFGTNSPVTLSLAAPVFLREGDRTRVRALVANRTAKARSLSVQLATPAGLTAETPLDLAAALAPGAEVSAQGTYLLSTAAPNGEARLAASLRLDGADPILFEQAVRTLPGTVTRTETHTLAPGAPLALDRPNATLQQVEVGVATSLLAALAPSLDFFLQYPYGCAEQVTSETVAALVVRDALGGATPETASSASSPLPDVRRRFLAGAGGPDPAETLRNAREMSTAGLSRLKTLRNADGSFSFWPGDGRGNVPATAIVLLLLSSLEDPGPLRALDAQKSLGWLKAHVPETDGPRAVTISFVEARFVALGLLSGPGSPLESRLRFQAAKAAADGTLLDRALLLIALHDSGLKGLDDVARPLLADVRAAVERELKQPGTLDPARVTPLASSWEEYPGRIASTLAVAGRALKAHGRLSPADARALSRRLLAAFDGATFGSTFETSLVLASTASLLGSESALPDPAALHVRLGGRPVPEQAISTARTPGGLTLTVRVPPGTAGPLAVDGLPSDQVAHARVTWREPLATAPAIEGALGLTKEWFRLDPKSGAKTPLTGRLEVGDLVYVRLSFAPGARRSWWRSAYYVLTDQLPAGLSVVEEDKAYEGPPFRLPLRTAGFARRDVGADRVRWAFAFEHGFMDRAHEVGYVLRAQHAGDFATGVARLQDFYDEELASQTASRRIQIDPAPARKAPERRPAPPAASR